MTPDKARKWIVLASLIATGAQAVFLIVAPVAGYPLEYPKNLSLLQIVMPVMLGYLGSAAHFIFIAPPPAVQANNDLLGLMVKGPIVIYCLVIIAAFAAFGYSNRQGVAIGSGMSVDSLNNAVSMSLGVLAATTGVIVSYLFVTKHRPDETDVVGVDVVKPSPP